MPRSHRKGDAVLLEGKNAVVYGGGGAIGGAAARAFAREGARVFLAGRTLAGLEEVAADIRAAGGRAETAEVDALDEQSVDAHADAVAAQAGSIDICLNVISHGDVQGTPFVEMAVEDYLRPVVTAVRTTFLTSRAAGRHMVRQRSGVLLAFGGSGDPPRDYYLGGLQVAFDAIEAMRRQLSSELGRHGVRFVTLRTGGVPETIPPGFEGREAIVEGIERETMLGRAATLEDVGNVAAFVASDRARTMTAATANISCGALID
jgi:3-oxoacyl-[acyl-carrier protein] reductase